MNESKTQKTSQETRTEFYKLKAKHIELMFKHDEMSATYNNRLLQQAEIKRRFLAIVGSFLITLNEVIFRFQLAQKKLDLAKRFTDWSRHELLTKAQELVDIDCKKHELENMKMDVSQASRFEFSPDQTQSISSEQYIQRQLECIPLRRDLCRLMHPDKLENDSNYNKLSDEEKQYLQELLIQANEVKRFELGIPLGSIGHAMRTPEGLRYSLNKVKSILNKYGINTHMTQVRQEDALEDKMEWLAQDLYFLEKDIALLQSQVQALVEDEEIMKQQQFLQLSQEQQQEYITEMKNETEKYQKKIRELEKKLDELLTKNHPSD